MKRTSSKAPLVLGIIGGIFAILSGSCIALCASALNEAGNAAGVEEVVSSTYTIGGWVLLVAGIVGLVGGCCAKKQTWGSLVELLGGVLVVVGMILASWGLLSIAAAVLLIVGGAVGMSKKAE